MTYSIVIPSLYEKDGEYLELCVTSLRESGFDGQIIVVTNGSTYNPDLKHLPCQHLHTRDQGQCIATNIGAQLATGDYLMVSNADMYYAPGWDKYLKFDYPVFSPNLVEPENNNGSADPFLKFNGGFTLEEFRRDMVNGFVKREVDKTQEDEPGFNLPFFIRKDVWDTIGGYDRMYDPWGSSSDTDLQMKVELAGIKPMRLQNVLVYHFSNKSGTFDGTHQEAWQFNWDYLQEKWGFNRDEAGSDTWYCKDMIMWGKLKYHPDWEGRYASTS